MAKYIGRRILQFVFVLFIVSIMIFAMVRISGTDPVSVILGGKQSSPEVIQNVRAKFGLNQSIVQQYIQWIGNVLFHGDFGLSYKYQQPVMDQVAVRIPVTMGLVLISAALALLVALPVGVLCALKKNTWIDSLFSTVNLALVACPPFLTSMVIVLLITRFAPQIKFTGGFETAAEYVQRLFWPSVALAFSMIALTSRVMRTGLIEQLQSTYIEHAVADGLNKPRIVLKHALKNAIIPVISVFSLQFGSLIVGSVVVEQVFSLAGLGSLLIDGIRQADYPVVQGITLILVFIFLSISLLVDILYVFIDPRIRFE